MTRAVATDTVTVAPSNNVYTVLAALATVAVAIGLTVLFIRAKQLGVQLF